MCRCYFNVCSFKDNFCIPKNNMPGVPRVVLNVYVDVKCINQNSLSLNNSHILYFAGHTWTKPQKCEVPIRRLNHVKYTNFNTTIEKSKYDRL